MAKKIKLALVGLGYWGPNHLKTFHDLKDVAVVTVCDLDRNKWDKIAAQYPQITYVRDMTQVLDNDTIDGVVVATDAPNHFEMGMRCLKAGKHVFIEKPLALSSDEAQKLCDEAERQDRRLMVGHLLEYHPAVQRLKRMMDAKELGEIKYGYSVRVNLGKVRSQENVLWSLAPHDVSVLLYLFGAEPERVTAQGACYLREGIHDVVFAALHFPGGMMAHLHLSWLDPHKTRRLTIVGDKKMCVFDDMEPEHKLKIYHNESMVHKNFDFYDEEYVTLKAGQVSTPPLDKTPPLQIECQHFVDCICNNTRPLSDGQDGVRVLRVLENIQTLL